MSYRVPNVAIEIPGGTSKRLYEPIYVVRLVKALWENQLEDPSKGIRVYPLRPDENPYHKTVQYREVEDVYEEKSRLRSRFLEDPHSKAPLFDAVYPGNTFEQAFEDAIAGEKVEQELNDEEEDNNDPDALPLDDNGNVVVDPRVRALKGVGRELALALVYRGFHTLEHLAGARPADLEIIPGIGRSKAGDIVSQAKQKLYAAEETVEIQSENRDEEPVGTPEE